MKDSVDNATREHPVLDVPSDLLELYARLVKLQKQHVRISAEIDNVRELIRQKG